MSSLAKAARVQLESTRSRRALSRAINSAVPTMRDELIALSLAQRASRRG